MKKTWKSFFPEMSDYFLAEKVAFAGFLLDLHLILFNEMLTNFMNTHMTPHRVSARADCTFNLGMFALYKLLSAQHIA